MRVSTAQKGTLMTGLLIGCGGFLAGILWMDLLFDTQILRMAPADAVGIIVGYYGNATLRAYPLNRVIGLVMIVTVLGSIFQLLRGRIERRAEITAAALAVAAVGLALLRVVPNAMSLGRGTGAVAEQIALARGICFDHMICLTLMLGFIATQIVAARRKGSWG
jgi:hypothetical protein